MKEPSTYNYSFNKLGIVQTINITDCKNPKKALQFMSQV